jgi:hypothetical protein
MNGVPLTDSGEWVPARAERHAVAITNVLEDIHASEKIGGEDGVLDIVREFTDEEDARTVAR